MDLSLTETKETATDTKQPGFIPFVPVEHATQEGENQSHMDLIQYLRENHDTKELTAKLQGFIYDKPALLYQLVDIVKDNTKQHLCCNSEALNELAYAVYVLGKWASHIDQGNGTEVFVGECVCDHDSHEVINACTPKASAAGSKESKRG
jgi:hypothetical protein